MNLKIFSIFNFHKIRILYLSSKDWFVEELDIEAADLAMHEGFIAHGENYTSLQVLRIG